MPSARKRSWSCCTKPPKPPILFLLGPVRISVWENEGHECVGGSPSWDIIAIVMVGVALVGLGLTSVHGVRFRCFFTLLVVMSLYSSLGAQDVDKGEFYLNFSRSAVFPYDPRGQLDNTALKAGAGFAAAFKASSKCRPK